MRNAAIVVLLLFAAVAFAETLPQKVTISVTAAKQPPVSFDHAKHALTFVKTCDTCHHDHKGLTKDTKGDVKPCRSCHLDTEGKIMAKNALSLTENPFHVRCMGCHQTLKKGPAGCGECHVKKS